MECADGFPAAGVSETPGLGWGRGRGEAPGEARGHIPSPRPLVAPHQCGSSATFSQQAPRENQLDVQRTRETLMSRSMSKKVKGN